MRIDDLSMSKKLAAGFGVVLALLALVAVLSVLGLRQALDDAENAAGHASAKAEVLARVIEHQQWIAEIERGLLHGSPTAAAEPDPAKCPFGRWYYGGGRARLEALVPDLARPLAELEAAHTAVHAGWAEVLGAYAAGQPGYRERAAKIHADAVLPADQRLRAGMARAVEVAAGAEERLRVSMSEHARRGIAGTVAAALLALAVGGLVAARIARSVGRPLERVVQAADDIASGNPTPDIGFEDRRDEIGALCRSFASMTANLRATAGAMQRIAAGDLAAGAAPQSSRDLMGTALAEMAGKLGGLAQELQRTVGVLASSSSQIATAATQFSTAAAETASAVSQTTATVEEVKQTALLSSRKARLVADAALAASQVAVEGQAASDVLGEGMRAIGARMDFIAQTIVRLAAKSQDIGDIVNSVRGLADQSNILAVNAAIEASKAGGDGKGFAVVAGEIRNLAEQSKESMAQIRAILGDIQKATAAAVMATEEGSKAVDAGRGQARGTREAIVKLAASVAEATQAATQIAASSKEELVGMDQVALAMENIRQASTQSLESARQLEDSVRSIRELADSLRAMLAHYRT